MITTYICLDLETTGLNPKTEKIIEVGAVKVYNHQIVDRFSCFVDPGRQLEPRIIELTGITNEMLEAEAISQKEMVEGFLGFCEELPLVGHNLMFDYSFLKKAVVYEKHSFERKGLDTLRMARVFLDQLESRRLEYLCQYFQIPLKPHRALEDAVATSALYEKLLEQYYDTALEKDIKVFEAKPLSYQVKPDKPLTIPQREQILRMCRERGIALDRDLNAMTRSEASRWLEANRKLGQRLGSEQGK